MNKQVARFVTRLQGDIDGLILGSIVGEHDVLKPNTVYKLEKCFLTGDLVLKEVGESIVGCGITGYTWGFEQQLLLKRLSPHIFLSLDEFKEIKENE